MKKCLVFILLILLTSSERIRADVQRPLEPIVICQNLSGKDVKREEFKVETFPVILTGYCNDYACTQSGKGITASGKRASRGTVASPSGINFGTIVHINDETRIVEDRGGAIKVENGVYHFDLWFPSHKEALNFGKRKATGYWIGKELYIKE